MITMLKKESKWKFNHEVAPTFDTHVRQSVPGYSRFQESVVSMTDFFLLEEGCVLDLGCATGETLHAIYKRNRDMSLRLMGVDESPEMIQEALRKTMGNQVFEFHPSTIESFSFPLDVDVITSLLTIQFTSQRHRKDLLDKIYKSLKPGGAFLFVEKCYADSSQTQEMFTQLYHDFKEKQGLDAEEIRIKDKSLRGVMSLYTTFENEEMLKKAGFKHVEMFFKDLNFAGWIAIK